jgi:8-amino-3,8-dideoxy-alpha-D-manno-octulosonate transaminase
MKLPYIMNRFYRFMRIATPEVVKPTTRGVYNMLNKFATYGRTDIFTALDIETNSRCNLRCSYCPVSVVDRGDHFMPESLFQKIIDDLSIFPYRGRLSPHFYGDPLIDERLPRLMAYARKKLPLARLIIHTNGIKLTREAYRELIDVGVDGFLITRHMRHWPRTVRDIVEQEPDAKKYVRLQDLQSVGLFNRGGTVKLKKERVLKRCFYLSDEIAIDYRGEVACTNDFFVRESFGNVGDQHLLKDLWWGPRFSMIRKRLRDGHFDLQVCRECSGREAADYLTHQDAPPQKDRLTAEAGIAIQSASKE